MVLLQHQASLYTRALDMSNIVFAPAGLLWGKVIACYIDDVSVERRFKVEHTAMHDKNYFLGSALHEHKHPDAKRYHQLSQARKTRYRAKFEEWAKNKNPNVKKCAEVWRTFIALSVAAMLGD